MKNLNSLLKRPVAFHPTLARAFGGIQEAILWQQLYYWSDKGDRKDGFIFKTQQDIEDETTLTRCQQDRARKKLVSLGVLLVKKIKANGAPTLHYKVCPKVAIGIVGNLQMELQETDKSELQETDKSELQETDKSLTESTQRVPKSTTESVVAIATPAQEARMFFSGVENLQKKDHAPEIVEILNNIIAKTGMEKRALWQEVQAFTNYWTEREKSGKRERWEIEKTFEVDRRLATWLRRAGSIRTTQQPRSKYKAGVV